MAFGASDWLMEGSRDLHMLRRERTAANQARRGRGGFITEKVMEARSAGVHPLYALGAATSSPSSTIGGTAKDGAAYMHRVDKDIKELNKQEIQSRIKLNQSEAERNLAASQVAREAQNANSEQDKFWLSPGGEIVRVKNPGSVQKGQEYFGEPGENITGVEQFVRSMNRQVKERYKQRMDLKRSNRARMSPENRARLYYGKRWKKMTPYQKKLAKQWFKEKYSRSR